MDEAGRSRPASDGLSPLQLPIRSDLETGMSYSELFRPRSLACHAWFLCSGDRGGLDMPLSQRRRHQPRKKATFRGVWECGFRLVHARRGKYR